MPPLVSKIRINSVVKKENSKIRTNSFSSEKRELWNLDSYLIMLLLLLLSCFSCVRLCNPIDGSPPGSSVPGILQARTLEWVASSFSNAWKWKVKVKTLSGVRTLRDPMDCSLTGSSIHGIFQASVLEWVAISFSDHAPHPQKGGPPPSLNQYLLSPSMCKAFIFKWRQTVNDSSTQENKLTLP